MNIVYFLQDLSRQGIELWAEDRRLRYRAPKEALTPDLLQKIKQHKPEILQLLSEKHIKITDEKELYPLSYGQRALWFLYQLAPESSAYNIMYAARLQSNIDQIFLYKAFDALLKRHPVLRTTYTTKGNEPVQKVHSQQSAYFQVIDASQWNQQQLNNWITLEADKPFNLEEGPVMRAHLLVDFADIDTGVLQANQSILVITTHHIAIDFWSLELLIKELGILYHAIKTGVEPSLPYLKMQYTDYVHWEATKLKSSEGEKLWQYWQKQLGGELPILNLPTDKPRPPIQTYQGTCYYFDLDTEITFRLRELAKSLGATLYMTMLGILKVLLHRYTGQEDIIIGSFLGSRSLSELEGIIGYFVNPVVLRSDFSNNPSFTQFIRHLRSTVLGALQHQDFPFPLLVERLQPIRDPSRSPLFQVSMTWDQIHQDQGLNLTDINSQGIILESLESEQRGSDFDLSLTVLDTGGALKCSWTYNTDLFAETTIKRMTGHFQTLLQGIIASPQQKVSVLPLLTQAEKDQLLIQWNQTERDYPKDKCIHQLIEAQVERTPDEIAVVCGEKHLTYRELNRRANQLANYLRTRGVGPEILVGISAEKSLEMIVGLLAILKAGGAYIPLDPNYPEERLKYMISDAKISLILTSENLVANLPNNLPEVIYLDRDWNLISEQKSENPTHPIGLDHACYVIYTSGSSGNPKGVIIEHKALLNFTHAAITAYKIDSSDRILQFASLSFDAAVEEIYPCLCSGAMLFLRNNEMLSSVSRFIEQCQDWQLTVLDLPTAYWQQMTSEIAIGSLNLPESLRLVIIGGEQALPETVKTWQKCVGRYPQLINSYGPTETTVVATISNLSNSKYNGEKVPIGKPLSNIQTYILDAYANLVPIGISGELYIGGLGVARGYLNRTNLTEQKFIPNLFLEQPEARLYKTGDAARYLADGNIEFLGRTDNQVKIRGFRIELGEIETALNQYPEIQQAVVIPREDQPGNKRLVGYILINQQELNLNELRDFVKDKLPEYMIPSAFVILEQFPLTPNGKINRRDFPTPDTSARSLAAQYIKPRTTLELQLAQIWSDVLGISEIGVRDNFFELGGHSLLAVSIIAQIEKQLEKKLPLSIFFQEPTIEKLANIIQTEVITQSFSPLVPIQIHGHLPPFFCVHPGGGHVFCYRDLAHYIGSERPFYGFQSMGIDGQEQPLNNIQQMATLYITHLQEIQAQGPYHIAGWCTGGVIALEIAQQLQKSGEKVALLVLIESYLARPLDQISLEQKTALLEQVLRVKIPVDSNLDDYTLLSLLFASDLGSLFGKSLYISSEQMKNIPDNQRLQHILTEAKRLDILPVDWQLEQINHLWKVFRSNFEAIYNYVPECYSGKAILFKASREIAEFSIYPTFAWEDTVVGGLETYEILGDHYSIIQEPAVRAVAEIIREHLSELTPY